MIITFVLVNCNAVTVAVKIKKTCVNVNKVHGYAVVYRLKKRQVYCEYEDDIRCDGTVVRYILPLCLLISKMNNCENCNSVIMWRPQSGQVYREYVNDLRCDGTVVPFGRM